MQALETRLRGPDGLLSAMEEIQDGLKAHPKGVIWEKLTATERGPDKILPRISSPPALRPPVRKCPASPALMLTHRG